MNGGSIQKLPEIPKSVKDIFKTVWEIKQRTLIDMAADRGKFIDQSQSLNIFIEEPNYNILTSMHFHGWKRGLKTGMYYLRTKPAANPLQFTLDPRQIEPLDSLTYQENENDLLCRNGPQSATDSCSSCAG